MAIHFKSSKERLDYLKGRHEEIVPVEVKEDKKPKEDKEPKKTKAKGKKSSNGKVQAK